MVTDWSLKYVAIELNRVLFDADVIVEVSWAYL